MPTCRFVSSLASPTNWLLRIRELMMFAMNAWEALFPASNRIPRSSYPKIVLLLTSLEMRRVPRESPVASSVSVNAMP